MALLKFQVARHIRVVDKVKPRDTIASADRLPTAPSGRDFVKQRVPDKAELKSTRSDRLYRYPPADNYV